MGKRLVCGVGLNDLPNPVEIVVNGKRVADPFYQKWNSMLHRCYSKAYHAQQPSYIGCAVFEDWLVFSNFKKWMEGQDWKGKHIDKDILVRGNKVYSPDTCAFVDGMTNTFILDCRSSRGMFPVGVCFFKTRKKFVSYCCDPFSGKTNKLGYFDDPDTAHMAWKKRKHELACQLADLQTDERVAAALRVRYL